MQRVVPHLPKMQSVISINTCQHVGLDLYTITPVASLRLLFSLIAIALQLEVVRDVIYVTYVSLRNELMPMLTVIIKSKSFNWGLTKHHGQV